MSCDGYHAPTCGVAQPRIPSKPKIGKMRATTDFPARDNNEAQENSGWVPARSRSSQVSNSPGFQPRPLQVTWEMTHACDWKAPSRAALRPPREKQQVSTAEAFHLIDQVSDMHVPLLSLTGGDPLLRPDLFPVIEYASGRSVRTSLTLLSTPGLNADIINQFKASGLMRVGFWLHGSTAALNDAYWAIAGIYRRTLEIIGACHEAQLPMQINTIISRRNFHDVEPMIELLTRLDVALWNVFFFVPANREQAGELLDAEEHEQIFARLYTASKDVHFQIKTTEGQHYQRYLLQQRARESRGRMTEVEAITCAPKGVNDGKESVFINERGEVYPSRFLPLSAGNVTTQPLSELFCNSELFVSLRDSSRLRGKCGRCPARNVCGGSRARAYVITGDLFAAEPCCAYEP